MGAGCESPHVALEHLRLGTVVVGSRSIERFARTSLDSLLLMKRNMACNCTFISRAGVILLLILAWAPTFRGTLGSRRKRWHWNLDAPGHKMGQFFLVTLACTRKC